MKQENKQTDAKLTSARLVAVNALIKMEQNSGYSNIVIDRALEESQLTARDKNLATNIFYGTLEKRLLLDYYIKACLSNPEKPLDIQVRTVLQTAVYQILFLERVPDFAAVDEAVVNMRQLGNPGAAGFANGVLRSLLRRREKIELKLQLEHSRQLKYSVPEELISYWEASYGTEETKQILEAFAQKPKQYIRINSLKADMQSLNGQLQDCHATALELPFAAELETGGHITAQPAFQEGYYHAQDLSAQLVCEILDPHPGEVIFDLCAAPGGKTFTIAEQMQDRGKVFAFDLYKSRVKFIQAGARRLGLTCIEAAIRDACDEPVEVEAADRVLCDVPCSGYGVISRKPEIRYKPLSDAAGLPDLQYRILCNGARIVKPEGRLVYATCTLNPAENEEVSARFLQSHADFAPCPITEFSNLRKREEPAHMLTILPYAMSSDGFFTAVFQKKKRDDESGECF